MLRKKSFVLNPSNEVERDSPMRIAVCCKGVPIEADPDTVEIINGDMGFRDTDFDINELDAYAIEAALALKERYGAETFALSLGPLRVQEALYFAVARGIDEVFRVEGETSRPELIAIGLAPTLKKLKPDLVLVGVQSEDWMGGEVGIYIGQALEMATAYAVTEITEVHNGKARVKKELGGGKIAEVLLELPALLCVQSGIQPLQYLSTGKRQKARKNPIRRDGMLDLENALAENAGITDYEIQGVDEPSKERRAEMISGDRTEVVSRLLKIIANTL